MGRRSYSPRGPAPRLSPPAPAVTLLDMSDAASACPVPTRRRGLRPAEKLELLLAAALVTLVFLTTRALRLDVPLGHLIAHAAAVVLGQGLVRDLARVAARRLAAAPATVPTERLACLCAESSVGLLLVVVGIGLTLAGDPRTVALTGDRLTLALGGLLIFGFVAKDWVLVLRRVEDHATIAVGPPG